MKKFVRKYITAKKTYEIGEPVDIKDEETLKLLLENGTIKEFGEGKTSLEKRIQELEEENEALKAAKETLRREDTGVVTPVSFKELSEMTHEELNGIDKKLGIETDGNKPVRVDEIWTKLSEGYEAGADEEV